MNTLKNMFQNLKNLEYLGLGLLDNKLGNNIQNMTDLCNGI